MFDLFCDCNNWRLFFVSNLYENMVCSGIKGFDFRCELEWEVSYWVYRNWILNFIFFFEMIFFLSLRWLFVFFYKYFN